MKTRTIILAAAVAAVLAASTAAAPANAQAARTWVSGDGDDVNPCSRSAPCRTLAGALAKTAAGGEVDCRDATTIGGATITKSITVDCEGFIGGALVYGLVIKGSGAIVTLRGLDINGALVSSGQSGISFVDGAVLNVENCTIRNFISGAATGILFSPSAAAQFFVSDTVISGNGGAVDSNGSAGIQIAPSGSGNVNGHLQGVSAVANTVGLRVQGSASTGSINVTVRDSVFSGSAANGIEVDAGTAVAQVLLEHVASTNNAQTGVAADSASAVVRMANSQVTGNGLGTNPTNGAALLSYGNNQIDGNVSDGPNPITIGEK
jgi:hypothetical protein